MTRIPLSLALLGALAACDGDQPIIFDPEAEEEVNEAEEVTEDEVSGSDPESEAIPETIDEILDQGTVLVDISDSRKDRGDISRTEAVSGSGGVAEDFSIDDTGDTLEVDNLAFDGLNIYTRGADVTPDPKLSDLGTIAVYHADEIVADFLTGNDVTQAVPYVALYDESDVIVGAVEEVLDADGNVVVEGIEGLPRSQFTIIRTGDYVGYGFGGYGYQRAGDTVIADDGQAVFNGDYAGLRVYSDRAQLEVIEGSVEIRIDFDDFNDLPGVAGEVYDRQAYNVDGDKLPTYTGIDRRDINVDFYADEGEYPLTIPNPNFGLAGEPEFIAYTAGDVIQLPDLPFVVRGTGESIAGDGEISGEVRNRYINPTNGQRETYEEGYYYGVIAGDTTADDGGEVVGVIVQESPDSRYSTEGTIAQETGGFIATR